MTKVKEPPMAYGAMFAGSLASERSQKFRELAILSGGVSAHLTEKVRKAYGLTQIEMAGIMGTNPKTYRSKIRKNQEITALQGSLILELAELMKNGESTLGSRESFLQWLNYPSVALGNKKPVDLINTFQGVQLLQSELESIAEGAFA